MSGVSALNKCLLTIVLGPTITPPSALGCMVSKFCAEQGVWLSLESHIPALKHPPVTPKGLSYPPQSLPSPPLLTCEARGAEAKEGSWEIKAAGARGARATHTLVHFVLTAWAFKAYGTAAGSGAWEVCPRPPLSLQRPSPGLPGGHSQWKDPGWSWHCPPLAQGELPHSLTSSSHREPVNPAGAAVGAGQTAEGVSVFLYICYKVCNKCLTELYGHDFMDLKKKLRVYTDV